MAEYTNNAEQLIAVGGSALFDTAIPCNRGFIYHRDDSGLFILRGIVSNPTACIARYQVTYNGNIAVPTGETVGPISVALAINGEPILTSNAIVTPAAVGNYFNVTSTAFIDVPRGCCLSLSLDSTSTIPINMQNANLVITREA